MPAKAVKKVTVKGNQKPIVKGIEKVTVKELSQPRLKPDDVFILCNGRLVGVKDGFVMVLFCRHVPECKCYNVFDGDQRLVAMFNKESRVFLML